MKTSLALRPSVSLTMTPALQQAIRLLQLSSVDLQTEIRAALDSNFMLEQAGSDEELDTDADAATAEAPPPEDRSEAAVEVVADAAIPGDMPVDADWSDIYDGLPAPGAATSSSSDLYDYQQANLHTHGSLREHLEWQIGIAPLDAVDSDIALTLIDAINDDGYLEDWTGISSRLCAQPGIDLVRVERILAFVQNLDPTGVGARNARECLRLQLRQLAPADANDAQQLLEAPVDLLTRRDLGALSQASGLSRDAVAAALTLIATLQPHPGRPWQSSTSDYLEPDVIVTRQDGHWCVALNPEHTPRLRINPYYRGMVRRADASREQLTLKQHLQEARFFIHNLHARNETLLRVARCIVEAQRAFLEYGPEAMRPLVLRDIAQVLGMHESTVSRATANKYLLTPRGVFELKHFFPSHVNTTHGGTCSATAIQAMIKRLIADEVPGKPLSDSRLAGILLEEGIQVARRTVAKYREGLRIPPSHERRTMA
ncbi:MAG TPA: RNA polymerase factor sigma-54 [Nevskiaceae bacterium]|nr:RNA polymerase factor sigma-54 [Nevskiaceae bacterium]